MNLHPASTPAIRHRLGLGALIGLVMFVAAGCAAPVRVEWTTATEMNSAGFNLYRSESPTGPFTSKVNDRLIPPARDPMTGGTYNYVDSSTRMGTTYYYELEEIDKNGVASRFGPIAARAGGLDWRLAAVMGLLAAGVLTIWIIGGRRARQSPPGA